MAVFIVVLFLISFGQSARILGVFPVPSLSHQVVFQAICTELSLRGHQVTVFTPNPLNNASLTNLTEIDMSQTYEILRKEYVGDGMEKERLAINAILWILERLEKIIIKFFEKAEKLLKDPKTEFDLIIVQAQHPLVYSLQCRFKVPVVAASSYGVFLQTHDSVGNPTHPIISPDIYMNIMGTPTMYNKICSVLHNVIYRLLYYWYILPRSDALAKKFWKLECPYLGDLERNVSLVLTNTNPVLHPVRPLVPNIVEMGQMHLKKKTDLPKDLKEHLDASTNGVIYVSLGTNVRTTHLPNQTLSAMVQAFAELPYNVLWKWENHTLSEIPENILVHPWFPQQEIFKHKNIKAFVTQGGLQSAEEAIVSSVPMVGIPVIGDQPLNVGKMIKRGIARGIEYKTVTKNELKSALIDVIENPLYRKNIHVLKNLFADQPMTGLSKTIWWIEYVLRTNGAKHLRTVHADLSLIEYYMVDVLLILFFGLMLVYFLVKTIYSYVCNH